MLDTTAALCILCFLSFLLGVGFTTWLFDLEHDTSPAKPKDETQDDKIAAKLLDY